MVIEDILRISDGGKELEVVFNLFTLETRIGEIELSKTELIKLTAFLDNAISAKSIKESKDKSIVTKILKKIGREEPQRDLMVNWV